MKRLAGLAIAIVLAAVAIFDIGRESSEALGLGLVVILLAFGAVMWLLLGRLTAKSDRTALPITSALWLHSAFEGALAALSFSFGLRSGLIVTAALLIHLLPESLAVIGALRQAGFSLVYAIKSYIVSIGILFSSFAIALVVKLPEMPLTVLATAAAGGFIYLAANSLKLSFQKSQ